MAEWQRLIKGILPQVRGAYVPAELFDSALKFRDQCRLEVDKGGK